MTDEQITEQVSAAGAVLEEIHRDKEIVCVLFSAATSAGGTWHTGCESSEALLPLALAAALRKLQHITPQLQDLSPELVETYLRRTGWTEPQPRSATFATFRRGLAWLDVPVWAYHFAYPTRFRELLENLSKLEARPIKAIFDDIANSPVQSATPAVKDSR